jgi:hypothetical protein
LVAAGWRYKATDKDVDLACRVMGTLGEPISEQNEARVLSAFSSAIDKQLSSYPSTLEQDQAEEVNSNIPW